MSPEPTGGTAFTIKLANKHKKPCLVLDWEQDTPEMVRTIQDWNSKNHIRILNMAGPRESKAPGIYNIAVEVLNGLVG